MNNLFPAPTLYPIDSDSFKQLYSEYHNFVYRRAYSMLGDSASAEDVTQNTFIKVYRNIHSFRGGEFRVWLYRIVTNACYDELRSRERHARLRPFSIDDRTGESDISEKLVSPDLTAEEYLEQLELSSTIQHCLDIMPRSQRAPLVLVDILEMDYAQAAERLGIPVGTLKSRLWRARAQMRILLQYNTDLIDGSYGHYSRPLA
jgi:RNA polymerase sigma-70 factor (ECF subfamily)